jgi:hypothetical protein
MFTVSEQAEQKNSLKMKVTCSSETSAALNRLYGVISEKVEFLILAAVRT